MRENPDPRMELKCFPCTLVVTEHQIRMQTKLRIAPWIVASRWLAARAAIRERVGRDEDLVDMLLEWAFCDQAPGVWCVQHAAQLEDGELGSESHPFGLFGGGRLGRIRGTTCLYGIDSGPYAIHIQKSLLAASTPLEVSAYAWVACAEYGSERVMREKGLEMEGRVAGFDALIQCGSRLSSGDRADLLRCQRRERIKRLNEHPGVASASASEVGVWFASEERSWHWCWAMEGETLVYDTYTSPTGELGYRVPSSPQLTGWTALGLVN